MIIIRIVVWKLKMLQDAKTNLSDLYIYDSIRINYSYNTMHNYIQLRLPKLLFLT